LGLYDGGRETDGTTVGGRWWLVWLKVASCRL